MSDFLLTCFFVVAAFLGLLVLSDKQCDAKARDFDAHEWGALSGCMVKYNGRWIPLENVRGYGE